jgi:hypothetical protein
MAEAKAPRIKAATSDGQTLVNRQRELLRKLSDLLNAVEKAEDEKCERAYDLAVERRRATAKMRDEGIQLAIIGKMVDGHPSIAKLDMAYEKARSKCAVLYERINAVKLQINVLDGRISREWAVTTRH